MLCSSVAMFWEIGCLVLMIREQLWQKLAPTAYLGHLCFLVFHQPKFMQRCKHATQHFLHLSHRDDSGASCGSLGQAGKQVALTGSFGWAAGVPVVVASQSDPVGQGEGGAAQRSVCVLFGPVVSPAVLAGRALTLTFLFVGPAVVSVPARAAPVRTLLFHSCGGGPTYLREKKRGSSISQNSHKCENVKIVM